MPEPELFESTRDIRWPLHRQAVIEPPETSLMNKKKVSNENRSRDDHEERSVRLVLDPEPFGLEQVDKCTDHRFRFERIPLRIPG